MFRILSTNIACVATVIVLMLGLTVSAAERINLHDTITEEEWTRIDALSNEGTLHPMNIREFMNRLAREDMHDPNRIDKALKGDYANNVRREMLHLRKFAYDPRVGLSWAYLLVLVLVPIFVVYVRHCLRRRSI